MKNFLKTNEVNNNMMSFTAFKSILIFDFLADSPRTYQEIKEYMLKNPYIKEDVSTDALRVYLTSLKRAGCEIERIKNPDGTCKYEVTNSPFKINLNPEQIDSLIDIYLKLAHIISAEEMLIVENFLHKIAARSKSDLISMALKENSVFKGIKPALFKQIIEHANKKDQIVFDYNSPNSGAQTYEVLADKIEYKNNIFYLYGTSASHKRYGSFLLNRIVKINAVRMQKTIPADVLTVGFELNNCANFIPDDCEKILGTEGNKIIAEISSSDEFTITQRLLSFGPSCKVLYPAEFKKEFVDVLKQMRREYGLG